MDELTALHTWARQTLLNRLQQIFEQTRSPHNVQFQAVTAILNEVNSFKSGEFDGFDELYELLILASQTATSHLLVQMVNLFPEGAEQTIEAERARFRQEIEALDRNQLKSVELLYDVRALSRSEAAAIWEEITRRWDLKHNHWYPIYGPPRPTNAIAFFAREFDEQLVPDTLHGILRDHGVERVYEFSEFSPIGTEGGSPELEMPLDHLIPKYGRAAGWAEGYWFSKEMDWLIYASHESSITVGGAWLIDAIKQAWPAWTDALYERFPIARFHLGDYQPDAE